MADNSGILRVEVREQKRSLNISIDEALNTFFASTQYTGPILVQTVYSPDISPTILVRPFIAPIESGEHGAHQEKVDSEWEIHLTRVYDGSIALKEIGSSKPIVKFDSINSNKLKALLLAIKTMKGRDLLGGPMAITLTRTEKHYLVSFDRVPMVTGGFTLIAISFDHRILRVSAGH